MELITLKHGWMGESRVELWTCYLTLLPAQIVTKMTNIIKRKLRGQIDIPETGIQFMKAKSTVKITRLSDKEGEDGRILQKARG